MRPLLALAITVVVLGGMQIFLTQRSPVDGPIGVQLIEAKGEFGVELTMTFDAGQDEFSIDALRDAPSVLLQLVGKDLFRSTETVSAETPLKISPVEGVTAGDNEFFVQVSPANTGSLVPSAVRVRIVRDGARLAEQTLWGEPGGIVQGVVVLHVTP